MNIKISQVRMLLNHIEENGGATIDLNFDLAYLSTGYMVSSGNHREQVIELNDPSLVYELAKAIQDTANVIDEASDYMHIDTSRWFVGAWIENDTIVIDASEQITSMADAVITGIARGQRAIFNNSTKEVLYLNGETAA